MLFVVLVRSGAEAYRCIQEAFTRWEAVVGTEAGGLRYEPWLRAVEAFLDGRGRMGSLVGASPEVRKAATGAVQFKESTLGDYYVSQLLSELSTTRSSDRVLLPVQLYTVILINVLLKVPPDAVSRGGDLTRVVQTLEMRASVRLELQRCGVDRILNKLPSLGHSMVDREVQNYRDLEEEDRLQLTREYNRKLLKDLKNPQDVFNGLMANISGTKAQEFLLGILRQLMLIKDDGDRRLRHFQLVNELVRAVVHDGTGVDRDFSSVIDVSVQRILSKLEETELLEQAREENRDLKSRIIQLQRAKESMTAELAARDDGLVGQLKVQLADAETKLRVSRENGETMTTRIGELEEEIEYLKIELEGLYELLRETKSVEEILVRGKISDPDRRDFLANLETERERRKTIRILEGRHRKGGKKGAVAANGTAQSHFSDEEDDAGAEDAEDAEDGKVMVADKVALPEAKAKEKALAGNGRRKVVSGSQFEDAADERVKAHIEAQLASDELVSLASQLPSGKGHRLTELRFFTVAASTKRITSSQCS
jgi:cytokinesis protein